jgi:molybdenum cofactor biosynthesis enzyme
LPKKPVPLVSLVSGQWIRGVRAIKKEVLLVPCLCHPVPATRKQVNKGVSKPRLPHQKTVNGINPMQPTISFKQGKL